MLEKLNDLIWLPYRLFVNALDDYVRQYEDAMNVPWWDDPLAGDF